MKNLYAPTRSITRWTCGSLMSLGLMMTASDAFAQLSLTAPGIPQVVDFDATLAGVSNGAWAGNGFQPVPTAGQLSSNAWASYGWSDGLLNLGGTQNTPGTDYRRGTTAPANNPVLVGGLYSFGGAGISGRALGIQPNTGDLVPGYVMLRIQNNTASTMTSFDISYNLFYRNDQARSNQISFLYSDNNAGFIPVPALNVVTPAAATGTSWVANPMTTTITNVIVAPGGYFYVRWLSNDISGTGSRDEFALDDISVTGQASTSVAFSSLSATSLETDGTVPLTVSITNPDPTSPTSVDVVLLSGPADRVDNYTTQTLTFPAGSSADIVLSVDLTDNGACDGTANLVFELQNVSGGTPIATINGTSDQFALTITDDNVQPVSDAQRFDSAPTDTWPINTGSGQISALTGATDVPANQRILNGTSSWQLSNSTATLELAPLDIQDWIGTTFIARVSSPSVGATNDGVDIADHISFYVSLDGAPFAALPDIRISGSPTGNARWGFATGVGVASTTAGVPAQFNPAAPGLRTTDGYSTVQISIPNGYSTIALRVVARNNSWNERWCLDGITVSGDLCSAIYFSRANGSEATGTWSTSRTGAPAPGTVNFTKNTTVVVQAPHVVTTGVAASIDVRDIDIETGGTLALTGASTLNVHGTSFNVDGTLNGSDATVSFLGPDPTAFTGTQPVTLFDLQVNGPVVTQQLNSVRIRGSLDVLSGTYNANNVGVPARTLTIVSESSGTGRLGPIIAPAAFGGNIIMERYVPGGATNWRLISAATVNNTLSSLEDDFITAGYPGSHFPNFESPVGSGTPWPSIRTYNEAAPGPVLNDGLIGVTGDNMVLGKGQGFMTWAGTTLVTTTPFTIDLRSSPNIGAPPAVLPMTYTNNGAPTVDGWNLVGNPLPSPIDFSLISLGADVQNFYYVFDPATGNNAIWDESLGLSIPSGALNGNIQSCQGFWLKANGPAVTTQVEETDKVLDRSGGGLFGGAQEGVSPLFRLVIGSDMNNYSDEALIHFGVGAPELGEFDIVKFPLSHPDAPRIQSMSTEGQDLMLNAYGGPTTDLDIPVSVNVQVDGSYSIRIHGAEGVMGISCLVLEDLQTGVSTVLTEGTEYVFDALAATPALPARFVVHASAAVQHATTDATCAGATDGTASITGAGDGPWDITWMNATGTVLSEMLGTNGPGTISDLAAGNYAVSITGNGACGSLVHNFTIAQPTMLSAGSTSTPATCAAASDGTISVVPQGGTAPYLFDWSHGATESHLTDVPAGEYHVIITDANGCHFTPTTIMVDALEGPIASFLLSATSLAVGDTLQVFNTGTYDATYSWDFGDGVVLSDNEPFHIFQQPGTYSVLFSVTNGECTATSAQSVVVEVAQGVATAVAVPTTHAWTDGNDFIVQWPTSAQGRATIDVMDATGRVLRSVQVNNTASGRSLIAAEDLPSGVYFLRIVRNGIQHTQRIPLLR